MNFRTLSAMYPMPRFINPINSKLKPYYLSFTSAEINMFFNKSVLLLPINKLDHISKTLNMINIVHAQTKTLYTRPGLLSSWSKLGRAELSLNFSNAGGQRYVSVSRMSDATERLGAIYDAQISPLSSCSKMFL